MIYIYIYHYIYIYIYREREISFYTIIYIYIYIYIYTYNNIINYIVVIPFTYQTRRTRVIIVIVSSYCLVTCHIDVYDYRVKLFLTRKLLRSYSLPRGSGS